MPAAMPAGETTLVIRLRARREDLAVTLADRLHAHLAALAAADAALRLLEAPRNLSLQQFRSVPGSTVVA